jgi:hypothetical protein
MTFMETKTSLLEPLLERAEQYSRTSLEMLKLKTVDKTADISSRLISRLSLAVVLLLCLLTLNIAGGLWLGSLLGKSYYGFLAVATFYGLAAIILLFIHPYIKDRVSNHIIKQMLN